MENNSLLDVQHLSHMFHLKRKMTVKAIDDVSFQIKKGEIYGLVGESGSGKSTVARCIMNIYKPSEGEIFYKGIPICKNKEFRKNRKMLQMTRQMIFQDSASSLNPRMKIGDIVAEPLRIYSGKGRPGKKEIEKQLELVGLDRSYMEKYPCELSGDAGKRLSGGEKQRIAIARAILKNAPIVILDEATAFTDPQNEDKIQKSIMALSKGKTLLVIAHRLSTIQNADQIVVLKKGRIVDCGKQEELLKRCPLYADMWKAHIGAKNWSVSEKKEVAAHV